MLSEEIIKQKYITDVMTSGINKVFDLQSQAAQSLLNEKTGALFANLSERNFQISASEMHAMASVHILSYLRFNEIRADKALRSRLVLYNRIVWGVLYGETLPKLKYGFTKDIKREIGAQLQAAGVSLTESKK